MLSARPLPVFASVAARAAAHFGSLARALEALAGALLGVEREMRDLAQEYRLSIPNCRLVLYIKLAKSRRPRALYWGATFRVAMADGIRRWRSHIKGRLTGRTIYRVALRWSERERFFRFDKRRLALNRRHAHLARALARMRRLVLGCCVPIPTVPPGPPPAAEFCANLAEEPALLEAAWRVAWALAAVEGDMLRLVEGARPGLPTSNLFPYVSSHGNYLALGWAIPELIVRNAKLAKGRRHVASGLSANVLRALRIPRPFWPSLRDTDRAMRALRREHARYAKVVGRVRRLASRMPADENPRMPA